VRSGLTLACFFGTMMPNEAIEIGTNMHEPGNYCKDETADQRSHTIPSEPAGHSLIGVILRICLPVLLWTVVAIVVPVFVNQMRHQDRAVQEDFALFYFSALELRHGIDPYTTNIRQTARARGLNIHAISHTNEPPTSLALQFEPLTHLPIQTAYWIWQLTNLSCFVIAMLLLLGPGTRLAPWQALTFAALATLYPAVASVFWFGQTKLVCLVLLVLAMRFIEVQRTNLAGFTLALVATLRAFPFILVFYLLLQQRWRVLIYAVIGVAIIGLATMRIVGFTTCISFVSTLPTIYSDKWNWLRRDFSIYFVISRRIWAISPNPGFALDLLRHFLIVSVNFFVLAASCRVTLAVPAQEDFDSRLFSLWIATGIFLLPEAWDHDLTLMLIPFSQLAVVGARGEASRRAIAMAILSYAILFWWEYISLSANELGFLAMLTGYLSAYWLAVDQPDTVNVPLRAVPAEIWQRLVPAA
jgi:glycosyl transferase family 87